MGSSRNVITATIGRIQLAGFESFINRMYAIQLAKTAGSETKTARICSIRAYFTNLHITVDLMPITPLIGTLGYLWDHESDRVLMIRRNAKSDDDHYGKVNGLGGKVESDESITSSLRREIREEASLELTSFELRGTITWSNFGPKSEDWLAFIFLLDGWTGQVPSSNDEGDLHWVSRLALLSACVQRDKSLPMWAGDRHFVPLVFDNDQRVFHGTMPYAGDKPLSWNYERI